MELKICLKKHDYFLFHGGGATDILGGYEVLIESNAKFLFKKSLLSRQDYKEKTVLNKWWFGKGSTCEESILIFHKIFTIE